MNKKQRLELTWIGKDERPRLEPRVFIEEPSLSYSAGAGTDGAGVTDNMLIKGDNLLALKALEAGYAGKVKCVFIDPPYNTGSAFTHYDDGMEHSLWLSLMRDRLEVIRRLLSDDGSLWVTLDDNEAHYFKVMCDEVFGRSNFIANVIWQKKYSKQNDAKYLSISHDHLFAYAKKKDAWKPNQLPRSEAQLKGYVNHDNDPRGPWTSVVYTCSKTRAERPNLFYPVINPFSGREVWPSEARVWGYDRAKHQEHVKDKMLWWGKKGEQEKPRIKVFLEKVGTGVVPDTIWLRDDAGDNQDAKREAAALNSESVFATPKPEKLMERILTIASEPGDLILDSFAGSGTTGAVAHKMGRRWIMVELGEHAHTHIVPRMRKVIDGRDPGGVTEATGWRGGGGFRYCRLAPSLLAKDRYGQWVIAKDYQPERLAEAVCKLMGFTYAPSLEAANYWRHGHSTETDFIFVTTQAMTYEALAKLSDEVGEGRTLLVACRAYAAKDDAFPNITPKKIPLAVLAKCEWARDDYSLAVRPSGQPELADDEPSETATATSRRSRPKASAGARDAAPTLFGEDA